MGLRDSIKDVPTGGGGWFKPEEHEGDAAILIEVKRFEAQRPSDFGPKDSIVADMTFFATQADLDAGEPSEIKKGHRVEQTVLCRDLKDEIGVGGATIVTLAKAASKKPGQRPAWVWRATSADAKNKVIDYADGRDAALQKAMDSAPDFD